MVCQPCQGNQPEKGWGHSTHSIYLLLWPSAWGDQSPGLSESHVRGLPGNIQLWAMGPSVALTFPTLFFVPVLSLALPSHWCICLKPSSELRPTKDALSRALKGRHGAGMLLTSSWLLLAMWMQAEGMGWKTISAELLPNSLPEGPCSHLLALPPSTPHPAGSLSSSPSAAHVHGALAQRFLTQWLLADLMGNWGSCSKTTGSLELGLCS